MANPLAKSLEFHLAHWQPNAAPSVRRAQFRKRQDWVIHSPRNASVWYSAVVSNLENKLLTANPTTIDPVRDALSRGLNRSTFERLKGLMNVQADSLARAVGIPLRTLARRQTFKPDESERIVRVASAFQHALDTFDDLESARRWFVTPQPSLGGQTPLAYCDTGPGAEAVEHLLGRVEHGVFT